MRSFKIMPLAIAPLTIASVKFKIISTFTIVFELHCVDKNVNVILIEIELFKFQKEKIVNGSILVIDDVDYDSEGVYKCEVTEERSFNTDVKESQMLVTNMSKLNLINFSVTLDCSMRAYFRAT